MIRTLLSSAFVAIVAAAAPATAQVYRWVDERGVVNYTNVPPPAGVQVTRLETGDSRVSALPAPPRRLTLPPPPPPAASGPPGDVDRATIEALGRAVGERSRCAADSRCANPRHAAAQHSNAARGPRLLTRLRAP